MRNLLDAEADEEQRKARRRERPNKLLGRNPRAVAERRLDEAPGERRQQQRVRDHPRHGHCGNREDMAKAGKDEHGWCQR